jgi:hypothetical protein
MLSVLDSATLWALLAPLDIHNKLAARSGYRGLEYFPLRIPHSQVRTGMLTPNVLNSVRSAHQSYRTERTLREVRKHPNKLLAAQSFVTLPEKFASLNDLVKLQQFLGKELPLVVYPPNKSLGEEQPEVFSLLANKLIEPSPELLGEWNVYTPVAFANEAVNQGYRLCLDLFHIRRDPTQGSQTRFGRWQDVIPSILPYTNEIHLSVGRRDFQSIFDSMEELGDIYFGQVNTGIIPMLELIKSSDWSGPIVTEIPASSIAKLMGKSVISPGTLTDAHRKIVNNLKQIMS